MKTLFYWILAIVLLGGGFAAGMYLNRARNEAPPSPPDVTKLEPLHLEFTPEQVTAAGIKAEPIQAGTLVPELALFGTLQEDPSQSFTIRAPAAGTIQIIAGTPWPQIGQSLADNASIGILQPRVMPSDAIAISAQKVALEAQAASAEADLNTANVALDAARAAYEREKALNAQDKNVSDRVVEEAFAKQKTEEVHVEGAKQALAIAKAALAGVDLKLTPMSLVAVHGGDVVELDANPEESVESGQTILRVARLDHLLAAVDLPLGQNIPTSAEARIIPMNNDTSPLTSTRVGPAASADPKTRDNILLFRLTLATPNPSLRPGTPVTAYLPLGGEPLKGVTIPRTAVVRYQGKAWVYLMGDIKPDKKRDFERREVTLEHPTPDGQNWFIMEGLKPDEQIVATGAAILLSSESNTFGGD